MVITKEVFLLILQLFLVDMYKHEKPVTQLEWPGRCMREKLVLNDCNWCRCTKQHRYKCDARACNEVDVFGHFNDAIRDIDVGMEGRGSWRSTELPCDPGVQYQRDGLLCVCTDDGVWPNPVCRDTFRILHAVEMTGETEVTDQKCSPLKLYVIGCNVCFCPSTERLNPEFCTKKSCSEKDPMLQRDRERDEVQSDDKIVEIYAECRPEHTYKLGCKTCKCLRNNRLVCGNCKSEEKVKSLQSFCRHVKPGKIFSRDCNLCYCDEKDFAYCSSKKCLPTKDVSIFRSVANSTKVRSRDFFDEKNCIPGRVYKRDCNNCYCYSHYGMKLSRCTLKFCMRSENAMSAIQLNCVKGSVYELNCLICYCDEVNGIKVQLCYVNPECSERSAARNYRSNDLDYLHGYCEPLHVYKNDCNTCHCLSDGKTLRCTSYVCDTVSTEPIAVDIVPVVQNGSPCPKGFSYKIDCNYCFCLSNGNAICTTVDCRKNNRS